MDRIDDGWLAGVQRARSPNCDARPIGAGVELVVVHGISLPPGEFGGPWVERLFMNELDCGAHPYFRSLDGLRVSAHLLVRRDGSLVQFVPFNQRAWHAGRSEWRGREQCNDFSVGIELEGCDEVAYSAAQYAALASVLAALRGHYPELAADALVGHADIAPGRKSDPGPIFDWPRLAAACDG